MRSEEVKYERSKARKRNLIARSLRDQGDHKGAFHMKIRNPKKGEYKRMKVNVNDYEEDN
jgi:hypothetical protein